MRRVVLALVLLFVPAAAQAQHPTVRDIVELSKAGLDEAVLLALIEVHRPVFPVDSETLKQLKQAGVAPNVIVAMVRSGRSREAEPQPRVEVIERTAPPQVVIVERDVEQPRVREVAVPVPVYVPVPTRRVHRDDDPRPPKPVEPVYWGWGGKLRPDAWKPTAADVQKDARVPREPQKK